MSDDRLTFKEMCAEFEVTPGRCGITNTSSCCNLTARAVRAITARANAPG